MAAVPTKEAIHLFLVSDKVMDGTNPEELIAAAHTGCFSMASAHGMEQAGYAPERIRTVANVRIDRVDMVLKS